MQEKSLLKVLLADVGIDRGGSIFCASQFALWKLDTHRTTCTRHVTLYESRLSDIVMGKDDS